MATRRSKRLCRRDQMTYSNTSSLNSIARLDSSLRSLPVANNLPYELKLMLLEECSKTSPTALFGMSCLSRDYQDVFVQHKPRLLENILLLFCENKSFLNASLLTAAVIQGSDDLPCPVYKEGEKEHSFKERFEGSLKQCLTNRNADRLEKAIWVARQAHRIATACSEFWIRIRKSLPEHDNAEEKQRWLGGAFMWAVTKSCDWMNSGEKIWDSHLRPIVFPLYPIEIFNDPLAGPQEIEIWRIYALNTSSNLKSLKEIFWEKTQMTSDDWHKLRKQRIGTVYNYHTAFIGWWRDDHASHAFLISLYSS